MPANHCVPHTEEAKAKMCAARLGKSAPWKQRETQEVDGQVRFRCGRCGSFFPKEGFYKNTRTAVGIKSECKACHGATNIASRNKDLARESNAAHMARARMKDPEKFRERERLAARRRPVDEKIRARQLLNDAVRSGAMTRPFVCSDCSQPRRVHGHHHDYSKPLHVRWLCARCHAKEHRRIGTEQVQP